MWLKVERLTLRRYSQLSRSTLALLISLLFAAHLFSQLKRFLMESLI